MNVYILDTSLEPVGVIDDYYTLIWTERHYEVGDFELELPISYVEYEPLAFGNYLAIEDSPITMLIETKETQTDEDKTVLLVTGESAETLLKRRSNLLATSRLSQPATTEMNLLVRRNFEDLAGDRRLPIIELPPTGSVPWDGRYAFLGYDKPMIIYDIFRDVGKMCGVGFRLLRETITVEDELEWRLMFRTYPGVDRTSQQTDVPIVVFSEQYDNLISGSVYLRHDNNVNLVEVITDDLVAIPSGSKRYWFRYPWTVDPDPPPPEPTGDDLYEESIFVSVNRDLDPDNPMDDYDVDWFLNSEAWKIIKDRAPISVVEGEFDIHGVFQYGEDFFMGDMIEIIVGGVSASARVIELVRSYSVEGVTAYMSVDTMDVYEEQ